MTLDKALQTARPRQRYENEEEVRALIDMARSWKHGRNAGKHGGAS